MPTSLGARAHPANHDEGIDAGVQETARKSSRWSSVSFADERAVRPMHHVWITKSSFPNARSIAEGRGDTVLVRPCQAVRHSPAFFAKSVAGPGACRVAT